MKVGGVLGLIGGVIALLVGVVGFKLAGAGSGIMSGIASFNGDANSARVNADVQSTLAFYRTMSLLMPIIGILGAGMAFKNGKLGGALMGIAALGILWAFGFGVFSLICVVLLGIGGFLAFSDAQKGLQTES
ncbi:hypothetical protein [Ruegeria sp. HKCCSP335]|uniref:hypothetical protein n=1 Tax=Ruegeria sp. HKCCSP335 TaxID=2794833 RepID=UPI001AEB5BC7|nr:hypothetical protein [Ruegeria sp. HKCCSP335]